VGFEPTTPGFEREKTVHALDRAATGVGFLESYKVLFSTYFQTSYACRPMDRREIQIFCAAGLFFSTSADRSKAGRVLVNGQSLGTFIAETPPPPTSLSPYLDASKG
jgi:hypothetical protein